MSDQQWIRNLFNCIDAKNTKELLSFLDVECAFRFGSLPPVRGHVDLTDFLSRFFGSIAGLAHTIIDIWRVPEGLVCHGIVTYTRHDGSELTVPFSNIFKVKNKKITDYLIFTDASLL